MKTKNSIKKYGVILCLLILTGCSGTSVNIDRLSDFAPRPTSINQTIEIKIPKVSLYNKVNQDELSQVKAKIKASEDQNFYVVVLTKDNFENLVSSLQDMDFLLKALKLRVEWYEEFYNRVEKLSENE